VARQAAENAREEEARGAALRREEEAIKAAGREQELAEKQRHEGECLQAKAYRQEREEQQERLVQAAKMERLREGVLLVRFFNKRERGGGLLIDFKRSLDDLLEGGCES